MPMANFKALNGTDKPIRPVTMAIILGLALLGRLLALASVLHTHPWNWLFSHPWEMGLLATSLLHGQGYSSPFGGSTGPTAFIAPGYPTLIAGIFAVFGVDTYASAIVIMLTHILLSLVTIALMMHVARKLFDTRSAIVAGTFWALSLPLLFIPAIFWESTLSECALIGMIALALHSQEKPTSTTWILVGTSSALIALINPALLPALLAIMAWLAWQTRRISRSGPLLGLLALAVVFAPWPIRNALRFHAFIPLRSTVGFEMWMGNRPGATGRLDETVFPMFNHTELSSYLSEGEVAYTRRKSEQASQFIRANPGWFVRMSARRFWRFWSGTGNIDGSVIYEIHSLITTVFGIAGLAILYRRRSPAASILLALPLLLFPLPYYITHAEFRYRLNIDPLLTILAAYAICQIVAQWSRRTSSITTPEPMAPNTA